MALLLLVMAPQSTIAAAKGDNQPQSQPLQIQLIGSNNLALNRAVERALVDQLDPLQIQINRIRADQLPIKNHGRQLFVCIGAETAQRVAQDAGKIPLLVLFASSAQFAELSPGAQGPTSALFFDPQPLRQAMLGKALFPAARFVALLSSPAQVPTNRQLVTKLGAIGLEAQIFVAENEAGLQSALSRALLYGDFLLGTADTAIYNGSSIKHLLLTTYRNNRVLIGPSSSFVDAGALASVHTSIGQYNQQAAQMIEAFQKTGKLPAPEYPAQFDIEVNAQVARSLNLPMPSAEQLKQMILKQEGPGASSDRSAPANNN